MSETFEDFDDRDFLAADYALGALSAAERLAADRRMRRDAAFRVEVEEWQARLAPLSLATGPQTPSAAVWNGIEAGLPRLAAAQPSASPSESVRKLVPAFWRWLAIGTSGLAAASIAALVLLFQPGAGMPVPDEGAAFVASTITSDADGSPIFAVVLDPASDTAMLVPIRIEPEAGQVPELWIARDGGAPRSLGTFDPSQPLRLSIDGEAIDGDLSNSVLAISLEPEGGSPTGQPTGPVLGHGELNSI